MSTKDTHQKFIRMPILLHLSAAILLFILLTVITLWMLGIYTKHNQAVIVPDVKGLQLEDATTFFTNNGLRYQLVDSVYSKEVPPGAIVEVMPAVGSKVKDGRIISVTVNAKGVQRAEIPDVADLSYRQAYALLQAQGFTTIETKYIPGRYRDLAIKVEANGRELNPGELVPLSAMLVLSVSDGVPEEEVEATEQEPEQDSVIEEN
ncbi:MAG: PASTA domain-containing protein [Tannerella sp.]|nr:PASTA domain-containing protein [Tannerella sp.]